VISDDERIDKPAPTNDCEQLVALFIRMRAAFRFLRPSSSTGQQTSAVKVTCTFATRRIHHG
jgi:hypothetical protein